MNDNNVTSLLRIISQVNLIQIGLIIICAWVTTVLGQRWLPKLADKFSGRIRLYLLGSIPILRICVIFTAFILIIPRIVDPTFENLVALLGALGLALGFAFKDYVSSLIAGIVTLFELPYRPGDWIEINGAYGEVKSINMRSVEIVTPDDTVVIIPHLKLWDHLIFNANDGGQNLQCVADFYLNPSHDSVKVRNALYDVALTSPFLQLERPINVVVLNKPWGTHYRLKAYPIDLRNQFQFITDLVIRGRETISDLGAEFSSFVNNVATDIDKQA